MSAQDRSWDDLRLVLAIAKGGGLSGASRLMKIHHSTVLRRLNTLEHQLGVRLFDRLPMGYQPTIDGEELAAIASEMDDHIVSAFRKAEGRDLQLSGTIRCATTDYLAVTVLPDILRVFREKYPEIELEVTISSRLASLSKRDADIALRPTNAPPSSLEGRRVCGIPFGVYQSKSTFENNDLNWISTDDATTHSSVYQWRQKYFPNSQAAVRFDSLLGIFEAAKAGLGTAILPCYMADTEPSLVQLDQNIPNMELGLWLLTHPDLYRTQRVKIFLDFAAQKLNAWGRLKGPT